MINQRRAMLGTIFLVLALLVVPLVGEAEAQASPCADTFQAVDRLLGQAIYGAENSSALILQDLFESIPAQLANCTADAATVALITEKVQAAQAQADAGDFSAAVAALNEARAYTLAYGVPPTPNPAAIAGEAVSPIQLGRGRVYTVAPSPDGETAAVASTRGIWLYTTHDLGQVPTLIPETAEKSVWSVAWSPDGTRLAWALDGVITIWDTATHAIVLQLLGEVGEVRNLGALAWSPSGTMIATWTNGWPEGPYDVLVWEATAGASPQVLSGHTGDIQGVAWSPDGGQLASVAWDGTVRIWDSATHAIIARLESQISYPDAVAWSPDGSRLAMSGGNDVIVSLWDTASWGELQVLNIDGVPQDIEWSPDGTRLAIAEDLGKLHLWDGTFTVLDISPSLRDVTTPRLNVVVWLPDSQRVITLTNDEILRVWDTSTGEVLSQSVGHTAVPNAVAWSPTGGWIAIGGNDFLVTIWDAATGEIAAQLGGFEDEVMALAWSADGSRLAAGSEDSTARVWLADSWEEIRRIETDNPPLFEYSPIDKITLSPDGTLLALAGTATEEINVWSVETGELAFSLPIRIVGGLAWSPDGQYLAYARGVEVHVLDATTHEDIAPPFVATDGLQALAWSLDSRLVAVTGWDGIVHVIEVPAMTGTRLLGLREFAETVAFSPDGQYIAAADNGSVWVWDLATQAAVYIFNDPGYISDDVTFPTSYYQDVVWSPDGTRLVAVGWFASPTIWEIG